MTVAFAPGRVNLIGDHTDYTGGLVLPMAIELGTTVTLMRGGNVVELRSVAAVDRGWTRYVNGVVAELGVSFGATGTVTTDLPIGAGLSSSAALEVAVALALGFEGPKLELAQLCQRAEQRASGVPCGIMDQLASVEGVEGSALLIDCSSLSVTPVPLPDDVAVVVIHSGQERALAGSAYAERRAQCEAAEALIGPFRSASLADAESIADPVLRRRARHVITENARVRQFVGASAPVAGRLMTSSHASLRDDFEVSTPVLDALVDRLVSTPGVYGARLTGARFGGCVVALTPPGALKEGWTFKPSAGARLLD
ncbi:MAG: galactokinase [Acidimicrobiaceae bacterium]|nr:galactokinase [Acidimicrobiaceae bacterium]